MRALFSAALLLGTVAFQPIHHGFFSVMEGRRKDTGQSICVLRGQTWINHKTIFDLDVNFYRDSSLPTIQYILNDPRGSCW